MGCLLRVLHRDTRIVSSSAARAEITATDPSQSAKAASLVYASDAEPGIARRRAGKGFRYVDADGGKVTDEPTLARIRALAIPPAWTDVWIAPSPRVHIQATGRDARGRKQYRYHARWAECRDEVKYSSLVEFAGQLPAIRQKVDADLSLRGLPRDKVLASVVWLLDNLMIRVGNAGYAAENGSFGLTTLRDRHVRIAGDTLRFAFKGKSGKEWKLRISDRRIARIVKGAQDIPGQHLFQYFDEQGQRRQVASQDVNDYLKTDGDFTSKHFRTWGGTVDAATELARTPLPSSARAAARELNAAIDRVAARLGNTRSVCRKCYVHPLVIDSWQAGDLQSQLAEIARHVRQRKWMAREEAIVLEWLTACETA
jgi:DNA topoisomerase-1